MIRCKNTHCISSKGRPFFCCVLVAVKAWLFCSKIRRSNKCYDGGILRNRSILRNEWYVVWGLWILFFATKVKSMTQVKMFFFSTRFFWLPNQMCAFQRRRLFLKQTNAFDPEVDIKCEILMLLVVGHHSNALLETFHSHGCVVQTCYLPAGILWAEFKVVLLNMSSACSSFWLYV